MAFQIKDFRSIVSSMVNWMKATQNKLTDFNQGSVVRTMVEAPAAEIDELYQQMLIGLTEAIPVSVYNSFNFAAITELAASGMIRVNVTSSAAPNTIAAGTTFVPATGAISYEAVNDVTVAPGSTYADVLVICNLPGTVGNILAGAVFTVEPAIPGFVSASNLAGFVSGVDTESAEARKNRFNAFIAALPRGTVAAIKYALNNLVFLTDANGNKIERVVSSEVIEPWVADNSQPIAQVNCYVHNGVGGTSSTLVNRAIEVIQGYYDANGVAVPGWKAAGVKLNLFAASESSVAVSGALTAASGYDEATLIDRAEQAIYTYIMSLGIGETLIKAQLITLVKNLDGVANIKLTLPADDVTANAQTKIIPGAIALT